MSAVLTNPATEVALLSSPIACFAVETTSRRAAEFGVLTLAVWHGSLRWCGGVLSANGFLATTFERPTRKQAIADLLGDLNERVGGFRLGQDIEADASTMKRFETAQRWLEQMRRGEAVRMNLPIDYRLGTPFQQRVWQELATVPWGETVSYGELAARIGQPGAARAVGSANGANPLAPVIPCHRVIAADGTLGGYGGGLPLKRRLLANEGRRFV